MLDEIGQAARDQDEHKQRRGARNLPSPWRGAFAVQPAVERASKRPHPHHRMTDCARDPLRVTEHGLEQQGKQCQ